jgi:hypothetical protein
MKMVRFIPIYSAAISRESVQYVPLLAKEGVKYNVGGDDARGGLLGDDNLVELLAHEGGDIETAAPLYLDVMKKTKKIQTPFEGRYSGLQPFVRGIQPRNPDEI